MNNLQHKDEFAHFLKSYRPNDEFLSTLASVKLALMVAPVATGRNTIIRELIKLGGYHYLVSDTTRQKRINDGVPEENGIEYWFRPELDILDDIKKGNYLGPAIVHDQQVSGINLSEFKSAVRDSKVAITDIEINGCNEILELKKDTLSIFLLPPSFEEWMRRLHDRGTMDVNEKTRRLKSAINEIAGVIDDKNFAIFINDDLGQTVSRINEYIKNGILDVDDSISRGHAGNILSQLRDYIASTLDV